MDFWVRLLVQKCYKFINCYYQTHTDDVTIGFSTLDYVASESEECVEIIFEIKSHPEGAPRSFTVLLSTESSSAGIYIVYTSHTLHCIRMYIGQEAQVV